MELCKFKGTLYGKLESQLFIFDSTWESFRPIETIGWDGEKIVAVDTKYKSDIFDQWYGFGSANMKQLCKRLTEITELETPESQSIPWLKGEFWRDRQCSFAFSCTSKTPLSWQKYVKYMNSKPRTLRQPIRNRATKRLLPK
jgi:hypothetical protein